MVEKQSLLGNNRIAYIMDYDTRGLSANLTVQSLVTLHSWSADTGDSSSQRNNSTKENEIKIWKIRYTVSP